MYQISIIINLAILIGLLSSCEMRHETAPKSDVVAKPSDESVGDSDNSRKLRELARNKPWKQIELTLNNHHEDVKYEIHILNNGNCTVKKCDKSGKLIELMQSKILDKITVDQISRILADNFYSLDDKYVNEATDHTSTAITVTGQDGVSYGTYVYYREAFTDNNDTKKFFAVWDYLVKVSE